MDLLEKFLNQVATIQYVWLPFLMTVAIAGSIIWKSVDYAYSTRLKNEASTNELLERKVQDYRDKLNGASPDEAKARMDALESKIDALMPRRISAEQRQKMAPFLDRAIGCSVAIASDAASPDASRLAKDLAAVFNGSSWQTTLPMVLGMSNPPASGIGLEVQNLASLSLPEQIVADALRAAGLDFNLQSSRPAPIFDGLPAVNITISDKHLN